MRGIFLFLLFCVSTSVLAQELVRNGSFSQGNLTSGAVPPEWVVEPAGSGGWQYVNDDGVMEKDKAADSVMFTAQENTGSLVQVVECQQDVEYTLSLAMKADGCVPKVEVLGQDGKVIRNLIASDERHGIWKHQETNFTSGKSKQLKIRLIGSVIDTAGKSGFDQISILPAEVARELALARPEAKVDFVPPGENIALNKPYTMNPKPGYSYCSDPDDVIQLTDGKYTEGYFWVQKSTVGWTRGMPIVVTIDLGREEPISGVSWNTAAGVADVSWPAGLHVFVSSDKENWFYQGDLAILGTTKVAPDPSRYSIFRYATDTFKTKGRWVQFMLNQGPYAFCDEIEVYRGQDAWLAQTAGSEVTKSTNDYFKQQQLDNSVIRRLQSDLVNIGRDLDQLPANVAGKDTAKAKIPILRNQLAQLPKIDRESFVAIIPLNDVHEQILGLNVVSLQAAGFRNPFLWRNNRWDNLSLLAIPPAGANAAPLLVEMMRNEVRGETVNITNPTYKALEYTITVEGLPAQAALELREVVVTDTRQNELVAAALRTTEAADGSLKMRVPSGCSRQIWLSFRRPTLADGTYHGRLVLRAQGQPEMAVAVSLRVAGQFPAAPTLHVGGWDYVNGKASYYRAPGNLKDNLAMMRDMYVDSPWATNAVTPKGAAFDAEGNLTNVDKLDFSNWDEWVERWSGARKYCVFMAIGGQFQGEPMGTARFNRMVGDYMIAWTDYLKKTGLQPNQLVVLLLDEPHKNEQDQIIIAWARAIRAANTGVVIFEDPTYRNPKDGLPEMYALCDVLCPNTPMMLGAGDNFKNFYLQQQAEGRELWLYSCSGPAKLLDPIAYHRAQKWRAFEMGAKGSFYWALGCAGGLGDSWNAYSQPGTEYSPYFVAQTTVMDGKHSEAIREGVQDYEYLLMLKQKIEAKKQAGQQGPAVAKAEKLLAEAPGRALANVQVSALSWRTAKDRSLMDQVRIEVLNALQELK